MNASTTHCPPNTQLEMGGVAGGPQANQSWTISVMCPLFSYSHMCQQLPGRPEASCPGSRYQVESGRCSQNPSGAIACTVAVGATGTVRSFELLLVNLATPSSLGGVGAKRISRTPPPRGTPNLCTRTRHSRGDSLCSGRISSRKSHRHPAATRGSRSVRRPRSL